MHKEHWYHCQLEEEIEKGRNCVVGYFGGLSTKSKFRNIFGTFFSIFVEENLDILIMQAKTEKLSQQIFKFFSWEIKKFRIHNENLGHFGFGRHPESKEGWKGERKKQMKLEESIDQ